MEEPCHNWFSFMEMVDDDLIDFFNQRHKIGSLDDEDDQIIREIMHQQAFSSESKSHSLKTQNKPVPASGGGGDTTTVSTSSLSFANDLDAPSGRRGKLVIKNKSNSSNTMVHTEHAPEKTTTPATSPKACILSLDESTVIPATRETYDGKELNNEQVGSGGVRPPSSEGAAENHELEPRANQTTRKAGSASETRDHIMAERKRRRQLTQRFIALSATIPGLKKIDKASILREAITHVKQLQTRVRELEEQRKKICVESVSFIHKSHLGTDNGTASPPILNSDDCYRSNKALPVVEARAMKKDVLIRIHLKKQDGIVLKILAHLKTLHLSTISKVCCLLGILSLT